jgi:anti-sigma-K factor RskA
MSSPNELECRAYLLGTMPDEERLRFEARYAEDDQLFLELEALEMEMIRDYTQGSMTGEDRQRFEKQLQQLPDLRARVDAERVLIGSLSKEPVAASAAAAAAPEREIRERTVAPAPSPSFSDRLAAFMANPWRLVGTAVAFAALAMVAIVVQRQSKIAPDGPGSPAQVATVKASLEPGATLGNDAPRRVAIPAGTTGIELTLLQAPAGAVRVRILRVGGGQIIDQPVSPAQTGAYLATVPASGIPVPGEMIIELLGPDGRQIQDYRFYTSRP